MTEEQQQIEAIGEQLRSKISAKFQTSTFLAGFAATILNIQITLLWQECPRPVLLPLSIGLMTAAIILFVVALIKFDALTMPKRFWDEDKTVARTDHTLGWLLADNDLWELQRQMIFYWYRFVVVGIYLASASVICLLCPGKAVPSDVTLAIKTGLVVTTVLILVGVYFGAISVNARKSFGRLARPVD